MDYFSKFLRSSTQSVPKKLYDHAAEFHRSWTTIKETLERPDERQLAKGIRATGVPTALKSMVDSLVWESTRTEEGLTGACMEYLLQNDVLGTLVRLSEMDRPSGIQAEVLRTVQNMVVLLDEQFLVHAAVHRAVLRLLRTCVGDDIQEQLDGRRVMGAAGNNVRALPSEYEEDVVDLLCLLCSRIRNFRELLMIFFNDKHWYHSEEANAFDEDEEDEEEQEEDEVPEAHKRPQDPSSSSSSSNKRAPSPSPSQATVTSAPSSLHAKKPEYEFILFNYLLRFVHREGRIGDFARAGLLFLMDVAMSPGVPINHLGDDGMKLHAASSANVPQSSAGPGSDSVADAALALAEYILDGDFCEVLGAGLAAIYSLLPSKLEVQVDYPDDESNTMTMTIGCSMPISDEEREQRNVEKEKARANGKEHSSSPEFRARIDHFVKQLEFFQDIIRCNVSRNEDSETLEPVSFVGSAIVHSILDAVRRIFLENVLYPSILECSDADGSAVAVMSYIDVMIRSVQDDQLAETLVDFLVSEDDTDFSRRRPRARTTTLLLDGTSSSEQQQASTSNVVRSKRTSRRKSSAMLLLEMEAPEARRRSEYLTSLGRFTLKDLLHANLRSSYASTVTAAMQLLQSLLTRQCYLTVDRLLLSSREPTDSASSQPQADDEGRVAFPSARLDAMAIYGTRRNQDREETSYLTHDNELNSYLGLVDRIDSIRSHGAFSTGYEHYLGDAITVLASHACTTCVSHMDYAKSRHHLDVNDLLLSSILQSLRHFYANTPELNMSLTGMLAAIASCPARSLRGWLLFGSDISTASPQLEPKLFQYFDDGDDRSVDHEVNERLGRNELPIPKAAPSTPPVILSILQGLVSNLDRFRELVPGFDSFLSERRQGLVFSENLTDALSLTFDLSRGVAGISDGAAAVARSDASPSREALGVASSSSSGTRQKPKSSLSLATAWTTFLSPRKGGSGIKDGGASSSSSSAPAEHEPEPSESRLRTVDASPFGLHYQKTRSISVEPLTAPLPPKTMWRSLARSKAGGYEEDEAFMSSAAQWRDEEEDMDVLERTPATPTPEDVEHKTVSLSQLLDNVVLLEECIKELASIIHARRSLSIDPVRFF